MIEWLTLGNVLDAAGAVFLVVFAARIAWSAGGDS